MGSALSRSNESAADKPRFFDFCFINLNYTLVRVQELGGNVTIRATADTFSPRRKLFFIRELAAEGFISNDQWSPPLDAEPSYRGVRWLIDESWVKFDHANIARNHRLVRRFILPFSLSWLILVYLAYPGQGNASPSQAGDHAPRTGAPASR